MDGPSEGDRGRGAASLRRIAPPFVGRRQELERFQTFLREAVQGHPRVVLIQGEAGIGKTRLVQEARSIASRHGLQVCHGRCYEALALPYLPFVGALRGLLEQVREDIAQLVGADGELVRRFLHGEAVTPPVADTSRSTAAEQDKLRLFLAVAHFIVTRARRCPMLFVMDDLHWADSPSLDLFGHLVFTVADAAMREPMPILLVATYRPVAPEAPLAHLSARVQREVICQPVLLAGLNESETHELVLGMGLVRPSHQLVATISEATHGNPLFIQEVLHHLVEKDALQERGGYVVTTASPADLPLAEQVTGAILARTQGLSDGCRSLFALAAFLGDRFSLQALSAVSGVSEDELLNRLEEGMRQRFLVSEGQECQFAHPLIRHVFYNEPSAARRQRIHQQVAESLQRFYAHSLDEHVLEIAHHLVRAGPAAEAHEVVSYARRAGDRAFTFFAWREAARYYEAVLSAAGSTGPLSAHDRADLHYWAGLAYYRDQDVGPCLDHYDKAIEAYRLTGDLRGLGLVLLEKTRAHFTLASVPLGALADVQPLEDVLEALGESELGLRGHISAIMASAYRNARQAAKAMEKAQQALAIGRRLTDDSLCAYASFALAMAQINGLRVKEALQNWQDAVVYARRANDLILESWPLHRIPLALTLLGRLDEAEDVALDACESTRKTQDWGNYSVGLSHLASVAVARGDFDGAEERAYETMLMVSRSRHPWGGFRSLLALACARALRGAWAEAEDALDILVEPGRVFEEPGPVVHAFARAFRQLLRGYSQGVCEALEALAADLMKAVGSDTYALAPLCALVELCDLTAAPTIADLPYRVLSQVAERGVLFSSGWMFLIPRVLGVAAALNRQWDTAEAHFQVAIEGATSNGARPELGRAYLDFARMLAARGDRSDHDHSIELVKQAGRIFLELGMEPFVQRAAQLAETLQGRMPLVSPRRPAYPDNLNEREVEVLRYIARGQTSQEIARELVLGPKTVGGLMSNIFNKIGVTHGTAVGAYALEKGLASEVQLGRRPEVPAEVDRVVAEGKTRSLRIILVTDMVASAALITRWGDAQAHELLRIHNATIRDCLRTHQGTEITHTGDGIEASFSSASSAVACAMAIQQAFAKYNHQHPTHPIHVRIGINAGEPISTEGRLFGSAVHTTFRICARARAGQILVSDVIYQLVAGKDFAFVNRGHVALKGFQGRIRLYAVEWKGEGT
jgi:class 3 adenylate cyclase/DNA-binding CsgD family transcriptional regulator